MDNLQIVSLWFHGQSGSIGRYVVAVTYGRNLFNNFLFGHNDWALASEMVIDPMNVTKQESDTILLVFPTLKAVILSAVANRNSWKDTMEGLAG